MANYPQEIARDAVCQSHTGHMIGLWFLPARPLRPNTNECIYIHIYIYKVFKIKDQLRVNNKRFQVLTPVKIEVFQDAFLCIFLFAQYLTLTRIVMSPSLG